MFFEKIETLNFSAKNVKLVPQALGKKADFWRENSNYNLREKII